jgi:DNA helicase-2/ATP-dependent DNA helicase PcrA
MMKNEQERFLELLKKSLNERQFEAVTQGEGPLLVLAGAGSGKTRVLTYRVAYLAGYMGIPVETILAVTFTNKAAGEMRERLEVLLGDAVRAMWVGTFHSLFARILRRHLDRLGMRGDFTIFDADDSLRLVKRIAKEFGLGSTEFPPQQLRGTISRAKNELVLPEEYAERAKGPYQFAAADVYEAYDAGLRANNALDFDDLISMPVRLFRKHPDVLDRYSSRFRHMLVDEYQDTNHAQYMLLTLLASKYRNLCVVGDDDQSIYRWRGAQLRNILEFEKDFPDATVIRLERNYRSTANILKAASGVVANNKGRKAKTLWTDREPGAPVVVIRATDERDEAFQVALRISDLTTKGYSLGSQAILYRINAQSRAFEEALRRCSIPYRIVGGLRFYERKEIKDIIAYLRVAVNPRDEVSLTRILNVPPRGIGDKTRELLSSYARDQGLMLYDAILSHDDVEGVKGKAEAGLKALAELFETLASSKDHMGVGELTALLVEKLDLIELYKQEKTLEAEGRVENIQELLAATASYEGRDGEGNSRDFLEEVSLITDVDEAQFGGELVTLMTLHCAKGLEFPVVFVVGLEDGLLPWHKGLDDKAELEEERRLFYVGMTRSQERLFLSWARSRFRGGFGMWSRGSSRFLNEIPRDCLSTADWQPRPLRITVQKEPEIEGEASLDYGTSQIPVGSILAMGKRVEHPQWGRGLVVARHGFGDDLEVSVRFLDGEVRRLRANSTSLRPL